VGPVDRDPARLERVVPVSAVLDRVEREATTHDNDLVRGFELGLMLMMLTPSSAGDRSLPFEYWLLPTVAGAAESLAGVRGWRTRRVGSQENHYGVEHVLVRFEPVVGDPCLRSAPASAS
jgi:hypothetical protein